MAWTGSGCNRPTGFWLVNLFRCQQGHTLNTHSSLSAPCRLLTPLRSRYTFVVQSLRRNDGFTIPAESENVLQRSLARAQLNLLWFRSPSYPCRPPSDCSLSSSPAVQVARVVSAAASLLYYNVLILLCSASWVVDQKVMPQRSHVPYANGLIRTAV